LADARLGLVARQSFQPPGDDQRPALQRPCDSSASFLDRIHTRYDEPPHNVRILLTGHPLGYGLGYDGTDAFDLLQILLVRIEQHLQTPQMVREKSCGLEPDVANAQGEQDVRERSLFALLYPGEKVSYAELPQPDNSLGLSRLRPGYSRKADQLGFFQVVDVGHGSHEAALEEG
jgi:hypothetical protein